MFTQTDIPDNIADLAYTLVKIRQNQSKHLYKYSKKKPTIVITRSCNIERFVQFSIGSDTPVHWIPNQKIECTIRLSDKSIIWQSTPQFNKLEEILQETILREA